MYPIFRITSSATETSNFIKQKSIIGYNYKQRSKFQPLFFEEISLYKHLLFFSYLSFVCTEITDYFIVNSFVRYITKIPTKLYAISYCKQVMREI